MSWLNYHHLLYFWTVAHEGSVVRAAERLHVAQPTISAQLRSLEQSFGRELFERRGRGLVLTEFGALVLGYADEIFALGRELGAVVANERATRGALLRVGVTDATPKTVCREVLQAAFTLDRPTRLRVREGKLDDLVGELALHRLDLVLADQRYTRSSAVRIHHHRLGQAHVSFLARPGLAARLRAGFPGSLDGAPALLPTDDTTLRISLEAWFAEHHIQPLVLGEFDDAALMKAFGARHDAFFPLPSVLLAETEQGFGVELVGEAHDCHEVFFALTAERRVKDPALRAIIEGAREKVLG